MHGFYSTYFARESLGLLESLIQAVGVAEGGSEEDVLEQEEEGGADDTNGELRASVCSLALGCCEALMQRFPK